MPQPVTVDVVLPCLDEAEALPWVLDRMPSWARPILADNGSTDGSGAIARERGVLVVDVTRRGYGAACHAGLMAATAPLVAFMDADASLDPRSLADLLAAHQVAEPGRPHLVVGARQPESRAAWALRLRVANRVLAGRVSRATGLELADIGPMRLADTVALQRLPIADRRSGYPVETVLRAARAGWAVTGVAVPYLTRSGRSKVTGTWLGAARAVHDMSRVLGT
ncbi:Glycosyltransferase involved in cell wall bisynthesis [Pedococcus dokdonensis]|uniref:Glycosyltransferase involved in cell wall bisynthesis n=1 Tax=Pedococcus dokdonensis TaxID=443156 RepID=A0A1H0QV11_9MICO|nr:glycosyltransferase family 2 protein [Pedococcus dokdonensis]SDP20578.1 Glycosyltransferase involved in cell wall bisynthesis [Pedococcus dokdonensis]